MPAVVHRSMQRHCATGSQVPIRLRTCPNCQIVFKSKTGLFQHQSRKKNVGCFRAGILRLRHNWIKKRNDYHQKHRLGLLTVRRKKHNMDSSEERKANLNSSDQFQDMLELIISSISSIASSVTPYRPEERNTMWTRPRRGK